jgi:Transposase, Mutator family
VAPITSSRLRASPIPHLAINGISLVTRQIGIPTLAVIDGNPGLAAALREQWPTLAIQRCTTHKLRN